MEHFFAEYSRDGAWASPHDGYRGKEVSLDWRRGREGFRWSNRGGVSTGRKRKQKESAYRGNASLTPPSTGMIAPVVFEERSEAKNSTASATSWAVILTFKRLRSAQ